MPVPSKRDCFFILEMVESRLINYRCIIPWADRLLERLAIPPSWLCDLGLKKYHGDQEKALREFIFSEPFEDSPPALVKFHIACLWLRYERRELSWAMFLERAGERLDCANDDWACEVPFHYLNLHEAAYFSEESERATRTEYLAEQEVASALVV